jgi:hypothetical protein
VSRWLAGVDRTFQDLVGRGRLTPAVGLVAVLLALLLGAGHAALPGHGKTILAAYLAGKRGRRRDALAVAGTVTLTHTGGVLALGLILSAGSPWPATGRRLARPGQRCDRGRGCGGHAAGADPPGPTGGPGDPTAATPRRSRLVSATPQPSRPRPPP